MAYEEHEKIFNLLQSVNQLSNEPFSSYRVGQVSQEGSKFILRRFKSVLFEVTGFGTESPTFKRSVYVNALSIFGNPIIETGIREYDMDADEIDFFKQKIEEFLLAQKTQEIKPPSPR